MKGIYNKNLIPNSKKLRTSMTKEEKHLWYDFLKTLPVTIYRQKVIKNYIVDFYCASENIVIEIDGSQHYEKEGIKNDRRQDADLKSMGLTVLRYSNYEINNQFYNVCADILNHINIFKNSE